MKRRGVLLAALGAGAGMLGTTAPTAQAADPRLTAASAPAAPVHDGRLGAGEWPSTGIDTAGMRLRARSDGTRLHLLVNALGDTTLSSNDRLAILVDVNRDGRPTPGTDLRYLVAPDGSAQRGVLSTGGRVVPDTAPSRSAAASGFGCSFADGTRSFDGSRVRCAAHRAIEAGLDLRELRAAPGSVVRLGVTIVDGTDVSLAFPPSVGLTDFSQMVAVDLAAASLAAAVQGILGFASPALEVTQATTDANNTTPLVAGKATVVRAFPRAGSRSVDVYLFGVRNDAPLPGSPLKRTVTAQLSPNRMTVADGATFVLPSSWADRGGQVLLVPLVADGQGRETIGPSAVATFREVPAATFWTVPMNSGTKASPKLPPAALMNAQEQGAITLMPTSSLTISRRPAGAVEPIAASLDASIKRLNQLWSATLGAWEQGRASSGVEPFQLPKQIYGFMQDSGQGGTSDPRWDGGLGKVATGAIGSSRELTLSHEADHNLDSRATGETWGRHIGGCDADDGDPEWPRTDLLVGDRGFDVSQLLPVATDENDLMTYCRKDDTLPSKWLEPYRWERLMAAFAGTERDTSPPATADVGATSEVPPPPLPVSLDVLEVRGTISRDSGAVALEPVLRRPGMPTGETAPGDYLLQGLDDEGGVVAQRQVRASFVDTEGRGRSEATFAVDLTAEGVTEVRVLQGERLRARRRTSAHAPSVRIVSPNGGERVAPGPLELRVATADADGDPVSWRALYTPDDGASWFPLSLLQTGATAVVDTRTIPGGAQSRIRVVATDGMRTTADESDAAFTVAPTPPTVRIDAPSAGQRLPVDRTVQLRGDAVAGDLQPLGDDALVWTLDGRPIAEGRTPLAVLPPGVHSLALIAVDDDRDVLARTAITVQVGGTCATAGAGDPDSDEQGLISGIVRPLHLSLAPLLPAPSGTLHQVNCGLLVPIGF